MAQPIPAEDRFAMIDAVTAIAAGADRHDWHRVLTAFDEVVTLDYTSLWGGEPTTQNAEEVVTQWRAFLPGFDQTLHLVANHTVMAFDGRSAVMEADFQASHRIGAEQWVISGHYEYGLVKSDGRWRVSSLKMQWTHEFGDRELTRRAGQRAASLQ
ncbi:nuclear transport factor 2 family protein [Frigidibacter oleivorans]|uniref:nuclear transport factor 2 family protein n=1 Tax=Frigidibacter oleivorans TaxID=2487129 RepID=UPI000F8CE70E|nr:nuclear transport factor 2 family protein [Frigidibacter oleivorans]